MWDPSSFYRNMAHYNALLQHIPAEKRPPVSLYPFP